MSLDKKIELEQIDMAESRIRTLGIHKSPDKIRGIGKCKSVKKKRQYNKNIVIFNDVNSPEFILRMKRLKEISQKRDMFFS